MKKIELTQGKVALVDDADFEWLSQRKWRAHWDGWCWYAVRTNRVGSKPHTIYMHRQIMNAGPGQKVDHWNRKGLDNQRGNLRICTQSQNMANQKKQAARSSRHKGVSWHKQTGKWRAYIKVHGKSIHLGYFDDEEMAAIVYNDAAIEHFGEFARLNVIDSQRG